MQFFYSLWGGKMAGFSHFTLCAVSVIAVVSYAVYTGVTAVCSRAGVFFHVGVADCTNILRSYLCRHPDVDSLCKIRFRVFLLLT